MFKSLAVLALAVTASNAAVCTTEELADSVTNVAACSVTLATEIANIGLNGTVDCESTSGIFNTWRACVMDNSACTDEALRTAISATVALYEATLPTCETVIRPYYQADFTLMPIPADFKEFAAADVNGTFPSQVYELCVNAVVELGYEPPLAEEWCGADESMIQVTVDRAFDQIRTIINLPSAGTDFVPPLSEIATITVTFTELTNETDWFGPALWSSRAVASEATFTEVEVVVVASTTPPAAAGSKSKDGLGNGAIAGIIVGSLAFVAIVFFVGKSSNSGSASERKGLLGNVYKDGVKG